MSIGVLLSTRGLTELITLDTRFRAHLLSGPLSTVLVLMAIATALLAQPLPALVRRTGKAPGPVGGPGARGGPWPPGAR